MAITNGYSDAEALKAYMGNQSIAFSASADVERAIETASRDLDSWCGRRFYADSTTSVRTYYATNYRCLRIDDAWTVTALTIDGTSVTLADYDQLPLNGVVDGIEGWPVTRLALPRSGSTPTGFVNRCTVTAKWGWTAVPAPVVTACLMLAAENLKAGEVPFGIGGLGGDGLAVRVGRLSPLVQAKLQPYRTGAAAVPVA